MTRDATGKDPYVSKVLEDTEYCLLDLLKENESLRRNVAALESETLSLGGHVARLRQDLARLRPGVVGRQAEADEHHGELNRLRGRLARARLLDLLASRAASALYVSVLYATHRKEMEEAA